jgi:hypothetical protein
MRAIIESAATFFQRKGELHFVDTFVSQRLVKEALGNLFHIVPMEESSTHFRLKIIRFLRLYGGPMIWPQAKIDITLRKQGSGYILSWYFHWPEYYLLLIWSMLFGFVAAQASLPLLIFPIGILFQGFAIFLDTAYVARRVRKEFQRLME